MNRVGERALGSDGSVHQAPSGLRFETHRSAESPSGGIVEINLSSNRTPTFTMRPGGEAGSIIDLESSRRDSPFLDLFTNATRHADSRDPGLGLKELHALAYAYKEHAVGDTAEKYAYSRVARWLGGKYEQGGDFEGAQAMYLVSESYLRQVVSEHYQGGGGEASDGVFSELRNVASGLHRVNRQLEPSGARVPAIAELLEVVKAPYGRANLLLAHLGVACRGAPQSLLDQVGEPLVRSLAEVSAKELVEIVPACNEALQTLRSREQFDLAARIAGVLMERQSDLHAHPLLRGEALLGCVEAFRSSDDRRWRSSESEALVMLQRVVSEMPIASFVDLALRLDSFMLERAYSGGFPIALALADALIGRESELGLHPELRVQILGNSMEVYRSSGRYDEAMNVAGALRSALTAEPFRSRPECANPWIKNIAATAFEGGRSRYAFECLEEGIFRCEKLLHSTDVCRSIEMRHEIAMLRLQYAGMALDLHKLSRAEGRLNLVRTELTRARSSHVGAAGRGSGRAEWMQPQELDSDGRMLRLESSQIALEARLEEAFGRLHYLLSDNAERDKKLAARKRSLEHFDWSLRKFAEYDLQIRRGLRGKFELTNVDKARVKLGMAASVGAGFGSGQLDAAQEFCQQAQRLLERAEFETRSDRTYAQNRELQLTMVRALVEKSRIQLDRNIEALQLQARTDLSTALELEQQINRPRRNSFDRLRVLIFHAYYSVGRDPDAVTKSTDEALGILKVHEGEVSKSHPAFKLIAHFRKHRSVRIAPGEARSPSSRSNDMDALL